MYVADQILATVREVKMTIGHSGVILNRAGAGGVGQPVRDDIVCAILEDPNIMGLEAAGQPIVRLPHASFVRTQLRFLLQPLLRAVQCV
jgi:hypothetical protein